MNNQVNVMIAGADMGGLIASCALHETGIVEVPSNSIDFHILRLEKDTLTREDVEECNLSGIQYAVNATLHDTEASLAFDEKCKEVGITVVHAVNLGKAAFLAVEKPKGYPFFEIMKRNINETSAFRRNLGKYISLYGKFWQKPVPWIDEAVLSRQGNGAWIAAGYCVNILQNLAEGREVKYFPKFYLSPLLEEL